MDVSVVAVRGRGEGGACGIRYDFVTNLTSTIAYPSSTHAVSESNSQKRRLLLISSYC
jgi:hypothetical protein